jgi:hypothetical protein
MLVQPRRRDTSSSAAVVAPLCNPGRRCSGDSSTEADDTAQNPRKDIGAQHVLTLLQADHSVV